MLGELRNKQGEKLDYTFHHDDQSDPRLVVLGHGVTGNKDRPFMVALAESLARDGFPVLRLSFAGNGASEGRFDDCHISKETEDLGAVLDAAGDRAVCYIGHSMGGAVGVYRASRDKRIRALVSLAGMVHTKAFAEREFGSLTPGQDFMWDKPECPLSQSFMDDLRRIDSVLGLAKDIHVPWLLVHGTIDDVVPISDSREIHAAANPPKELIELPDVDHVFSDAGTEAMCRAVAGWLARNFART